MSYSVQIEQIGMDGIGARNATVRHFQDREEALALLRHAVTAAQPLRQPVALSLYDPEGRLLVAFTTKARDCTGRFSL